MDFNKKDRLATKSANNQEYKKIGEYNHYAWTGHYVGFKIGFNVGYLEGYRSPRTWMIIAMVELVYIVVDIFKHFIA